MRFSFPPAHWPVAVYHSAVLTYPALCSPGPSPLLHTQNVFKHPSSVLAASVWAKTSADLGVVLDELERRKVRGDRLALIK